MEFLNQLLFGESVAHALFIFGLVIALGLMIGNIRFGTIKLGVAGVLFSGILFGHFHLTIDHTILEFAREFGLILFVYTIGLQVGPGFFQSLKKQGLKLNLLAASIVLGGVLITLLLIFTQDIPVPAAVGLFSGATTNTPSLGATQEALNFLGTVDEASKKLPGLAYAMAYPFGIVGIILTMLIIKFGFRIRPQEEAKEFDRQLKENTTGLSSVNLSVDNPNLDQVMIRDIPALLGSGVIISRVMHGTEVQTAHLETVLHLDDIVHLVGPEKKLKDFWRIIGRPSVIDLKEDVPSAIQSRHIILTKKSLVGKTVQDVCMTGFQDITITRVFRAGIELPATPELQLEFADTLIVVGDGKTLEKATHFLGNSQKELDIPHLLSLFVGISLGVLVGSIPFYIPGVPAPVKLGLAGGPLLVAICLSRIGHLGPLIWFMPMSANLMLREVGIALFLACVGLKSGDKFISTLLHGDGFLWMGYGVLITFVPLIIAAFIARALLKLNFLSLCGLLAGSMTDPPALAFANGQAKSSATSLAYATVYPLVMLMRVLSTQIIVLLLL